MKGNTIVSAGQAWGPSPSLVSRKPEVDLRVIRRYYLGSRGEVRRVTGRTRGHKLGWFVLQIRGTDNRG